MTSDELRSEGDEKKVTVIVTVYNLEDYIEECLLSLINQIYKNIEIIVINDGSTDTSCEKIKELSENDKRITLVNKENGGVSSARNSGLDIATGSYIMFVDGDDVLSPEAIKECVDVFSKDKDVDAVFFECEKFTNTPILSNDNTISGKEYLTHQELLHTIAKGDFDSSIVWAKLYKAELWEKIRFEPGMTREDEYVNTDIYLLIENAVRLQKKMYYYRMREDSITHTANKKGKEDTVKAFEHRINLLCNGSKDDCLHKFRYIEAISDLYIDASEDERARLREIFRLNYSLGNNEILWKRRVWVLIFRISPGLFTRLKALRGR